MINNGIPNDRRFYVVNTMIDTLLKHRPNFIKPPIWDEVGLKESNYIVITLHRPANVDEEHILKELMDEILAHSKNIPIIFPVHPRTAKQLEIYSQERTWVVDNFKVTKAYGVKGFKSIKTKIDKGHKTQFHEFINRVKNGGEPLIPINEIFNVTKASFAAIESMKTRKWINVG